MYKHNTDKMTHIGELIKNILKSYQSSSNSNMIRIWKFWNNAVGSAVAENAQPATFKKDVLTVTVSCSAWIHHLHFLKKEIISKLNLNLEKKLIQQIKFKVGTLN